jgi:hypothetical protein
MVALKWDELTWDEPTWDEPMWDQTEPTGSRPHLYVGAQGRRPLGRRRVSAAQRGRGQHRWKFAVRRALVVLVIASLGALAWSAAQKLVAAASTDGGTGAACATLMPASPGPAPAPAGTLESSSRVGGAAVWCSRTYVAAPGDTVWSIAVRFARGGDPRPLVDRLEAEIGGRMLQPGQRLTVP